ncbi:MAG: transglutaminase family protein [Verrucomicrobiota bacterium]|nr:transglutaminase family protein [Verrucomicrobiota bacterium]
MKLGLRYETLYRYEEVVAFAPHDLRLFPRGDRFSRVRRLDLKANGEAAVRFSRDVFDNVVASCFYPAQMQELRYHLEIDLDLEERDAFDFILESSAVEMPFAYSPELGSILAPFTKRQTSAPLHVPNWAPPGRDRAGTVSALVELNHALHKSIEYERREEGAARSPEETLRLGKGACRDVTVLLAEVLRSAGLAARLVSGYLREADATTRRAEGSLHAWTEVFLPGAGWIGMDATNGVFCNHNFIAAAAGLLPAHVTPITGKYFHARKIQSEMTSRLELVQL